MLKLAMLFILASCVGAANTKCDSCTDKLSSACETTECSGQTTQLQGLSMGTELKLNDRSQVKLNKGDQEPPQNALITKPSDKPIESGEKVSCDDNVDCKSSGLENNSPDNSPAFVLDSSQSEAPEVVLLVTPINSLGKLNLEEWRQKAECTNCSVRRKIDVLTLNTPLLDRVVDWKKISEIIEDKYESVSSLQILVFPGVQASFLQAIDLISKDVKYLDRVIFLDPGATEGLNSILSFSSSTAKIRKLKESNENFPSLEVLALNIGRSFEKDRRRVLAGHPSFFYVELALSESVSVSYLVDWFITSRLGLNGPLVYGKASKVEIEKIRKLTPAAWFQRTSGSKTEDVSDDTLTLTLP